MDKVIEEDVGEIALLQARMDELEEGIDQAEGFTRPMEAEEETDRMSEEVDRLLPFDVRWDFGTSQFRMYVGDYPNSIVLRGGGAAGIGYAGSSIDGNGWIPLTIRTGSATNIYLVIDDNGWDVATSRRGMSLRDGVPICRISGYGSSGGGMFVAQILTYHHGVLLLPDKQVERTVVSLADGVGAQAGDDRWYQEYKVDGNPTRPAVEVVSRVHYSRESGTLIMFRRRLVFDNDLRLASVSAESASDVFPTYQDLR